MAGYSTFESQWAGPDCKCPSAQSYGDGESLVERLSRPLDDLRQAWRQTFNQSDDRTRAQMQMESLRTFNDATKSMIRAGKKPYGPAGTLGPIRGHRLVRPLTRDQAMWLLRSTIWYWLATQRPIDRTNFTPAEQDALIQNGFGQGQPTYMAFLMQKGAIPFEYRWGNQVQDIPLAADEDGLAGYGAYWGHEDEYGKLFGQGGWFQKTFRPESFANWQAQQGDITLNPPAVIETEGVAVSNPNVDVDAGGGSKPGLFARLFGTRASRQASRQERSLERIAGSFVPSPTGNENTKFRVNADGSVTQFNRNAQGGWSPSKNYAAGSNQALSVTRAAKSARWADIAQGIGAGVSALPGILQQFGIGPAPAAQTALPAGPMPGMPMEEPKRPFPWVWVGVGTLAVVVLVAASRRRPAPAPAPAAPAPRRRRTR